MGFLSRIFGQTSKPEIKEDRNWSPGDDRWYAPGYMLSGSGVATPVNPYTAMQSPGFNASVTLISETIASLPLTLFRRDSRGQQQEANGSSYELLLKFPNRYTSQYTFFSTMMRHILIFGNFYAEIERSTDGRPTNLYPLHPTNVELKRDKGMYWVVRTPGSGSERTFKFEDILHIHYPSDDPLEGISPVMHDLHDLIALDLSAVHFGNSMFRNGASPGLILHHPGKLSTEAGARLKDAVNNAHRGVERAGNTMVVEEGMEVTQLNGTSFNEYQYAELRQTITEQIGMVLRIPGAMLLSTSKATNRSSEQQVIDFVRQCIMPWVKRIETELSFQLTKTDSLYWKFNLNSLQRADYETRMRGYAVGLEHGIFSINEVREYEGLNTINGGNIRVRPLNLVDITQKVEPTNTVADGVPNTTRTVERQTLNPLNNKSVRIKDVDAKVGLDKNGIMTIV